MALVVALPVGCGPVEYLAQVGGRASASLAQARREKADELAPYEYTAAAEYLKKAREEAGRSQYQTALEYGLLAEELADRAKALSRERKAGRSWEEPGSGERSLRGGSSSGSPSLPRTPASEAAAAGGSALAGEDTPSPEDGSVAPGRHAEDDEAGSPGVKTPRKGRLPTHEEPQP